MTDTAGGWLDERLDGDGRWTSTDADFDVEAEAIALVERAESSADDVAPDPVGETESWLAEHRVAAPVEPEDEIVIQSAEIEAAMVSVDEIVVIDGAGPWSPDDVDPGVVDLGAATSDAEAEVEPGGVVDPFDVYLATTEDDAATIEPLASEDDAASSGTPDAGDEVAELGSVVDDIAPDAEPEAGTDTVVSDDDGASAGTTGVRDAAEDGAEPDETLTAEPIGATSRLDAFDLPDAGGAGDELTPLPTDDEDPGDGETDLFDGDMS